MPARLSAFLVWLLVAASLAAWGLRLLTKAPAAPSHTISVGDNVALNGDLTRLFGAAPVQVVAAAPVVDYSARFKLTGVLAPRAPATQGVALIAVDGKMPRAYGIGSTLDGDMVLLSVSMRSASIGPRGASPAAVLSLPPPPSAATGSLALPEGAIQPMVQPQMPQGQSAPPPNMAPRAGMQAGDQPPPPFTPNGGPRNPDGSRAATR